MNIKIILKRIIGINNIKKIISYKNYFKSKFLFQNKINILSDCVEKIYSVNNSKKHIFCGYFDLNPDNPYNDEEILVGMLDKNAKCGMDYLTIAIVNFKSNDINLLSTTTAWNWQMGSRLRWSNKKNIIYYNDFDNEQYCCNIFNISNKKIIKKIPYALYDISSNEEFGISLNFSRLQRLRPGYGYSNLPDETINENAPNNDGLFYIDIKSNSKKLLVSYRELSNLIPESKNKQCYINHVSISPDNKKIMFFFIWKTSESPGWKATLWLYDLKTESFKCLEKKDQVSHYAWKDNNNLLITCASKTENRCFYRLYNCLNNNFTDLKNSKLNIDGHPVYSRVFDGFYSDTYPNNKFTQLFFEYKNEDYIPLIELYHDPRMFDEKRCDLHPHYFRNSEFVCLDTTYKKNRRQVLVVKINNEK